MIVVDASVALSWRFADESNAYSDAALRHAALRGCVVPAIWPLEVANVLAIAERKGRGNRNSTDRYLRIVSELRIAVDPVDAEDVFGDVLDLAREEGLSAYDASYLALAIRRDLALATLDERLRRACERRAIEWTIPDTHAEP